jgi:transcriptional regulator with XRE-family HTH domain
MPVLGDRTLANQDLAERMKLIRDSLGMSQKMLSSRLELGATTWQNYERGLNYPSGETLLKLRQEGFNPTWILTGEGPMRMAASGTQHTDFDRELFADCFTAVYELLEELGKERKAETLMNLAFQVYEMQVEQAAKGSTKMSMAAVLRLVKSAA